MGAVVPGCEGLAVGLQRLQREWPRVRSAVAWPGAPAPSGAMTDAYCSHEGGGWGSKAPKASMRARVSTIARHQQQSEGTGQMGGVRGNCCWRAGLAGAFWVGGEGRVCEGEVSQVNPRRES